jgi:hypothetical protein
MLEKISLKLHVEPSADEEVEDHVEEDGPLAVESLPCAIAGASMSVKETPIITKRKGQERNLELVTLENWSNRLLRMWAKAEQIHTPFGFEIGVSVRLRMLAASELLFSGKSLLKQRVILEEEGLPLLRDLAMHVGGLIWNHAVSSLQDIVAVYPPEILEAPFPY